MQMSHENKPTLEHTSDQTDQNDAVHDLIPSLWILICTFLEPFERFRVGATCKVLYAPFSLSTYSIYPFYVSDVAYWTRHMQWMLSSIRPHDHQQHQPRTLSRSVLRRTSTHLPFYALNLYAFDEMSQAQLFNCKYFIIWYDKLCALRVNRKIEKMEHLVRIKDEQEHQMARLSDTDEENNSDDSYRDSDFDKLKHKLAQEEKEQQSLEHELHKLQIDSNSCDRNRLFIPTTIVHLYMHELSNTDQSAMRWICDCIRHCSSDACTVFRDLHFDKSHLDNTSIAMFCDTLLLRQPQSFSCLRSIFFSGNLSITDACISRLLHTLYTTCDALVYIDLDRTGITNETCRILYEFYTSLLSSNDVASIKQQLPPWQYIDLSNNIIDIRGVDMINDIFVKFGRFNVKNAASLEGLGDTATHLHASQAVPLELEVDVANCNWSIARVTWSDRILYDI